MRTRLRLIVEGSRGFEITVSALIVVSLAAFSIETLPDLSPAVMSVFVVGGVCHGAVVHG